MAVVSSSPPQRALRYVSARCAGPALDPTLPVTLNFHPDRPVGGRTVVEALADDGRYLSQFVTAISNGGLTAHPGGDRWRWESRMFGGAYDDADPHERPVYGALDHRRRPGGGAPRFGSSYLLLTDAVLSRCTFCYPDSVFAPTSFGVAARCDLADLADADTPADPLDHYVEAHVHGPVRLDRDVTALVLDASYRGSPVETASRCLPCPVRWHPGFRLDVADLRRNAAYRGPRYAELGARIAVDGWLTPRIIGDAARTGRHDPQDLKRVWHYLARFGPPASDSNSARSAGPYEHPTRVRHEDPVRCDPPVQRHQPVPEPFNGEPGHRPNHLAQEHHHRGDVEELHP